MKRAVLVVVVLALSGCACLKDKPALRTALIATGSALLAGSISHARDNDPAPNKRATDPDCHKDKRCF